VIKFILREIAEKDGLGSVWIVKNSVLEEHGLSHLISTQTESKPKAEKRKRSSQSEPDDASQPPAKVSQSLDISTSFPLLSFFLSFFLSNTDQCETNRSEITENDHRRGG